MHKKTMLMALAAIGLLFFGLLGCATMSSSPIEGYSGVYLQNNIHGYIQGKDYHASYANYVQPDTGHFFIPVNTKVSVSSWRRGFTLTRQDTGQLVYFEYRSGNMGGMSVEEYLNIITAPKPASLSGLSGTDLKGIKEGRVMNGMTKKGVQIAWGYPAMHKTPSLEDNVWTYWRNRWVMKTVTFSNGKVTQVQ